MTRSASSAIYRTFLLAALVCILIARTAVPAGWMLMPTADGGIVLAPCSGMGAMQMVHDEPAANMPGMSMAGMDMHGADTGMSAMPAHHAATDPGDRDTRHPDPAGDHPCSGAGVSVALETPLATLPAALRLPPEPVQPARLTPMVGRGLAAPPPPATGPPLLA